MPPSLHSETKVSWMWPRFSGRSPVNFPGRAKAANASRTSASVGVFMRLRADRPRSTAIRRPAIGNELGGSRSSPPPIFLLFRVLSTVIRSTSSLAAASLQLPASSFHPPPSPLPPAGGGKTSYELRATSKRFSGFRFRGRASQFLPRPPSMCCPSLQGRGNFARRAKQGRVRR